MPLAPPPPGGPQFAAGSKPHGNQATQDLNVLISQPLTFLTAGIFARVHQATVQAVPATTYTPVEYDTVDEDPYGGWSGSPNWWWKPPAGCSGWYDVRAAVSIAAGTGMRFVVAVSGTIIYSPQQVIPASPMIECSSVPPVYLVGGHDYVQAQVYLDTGQNTDVTAGQQSLMEISWVSN